VDEAEVFAGHDIGLNHIAVLLEQGAQLLISGSIGHVSNKDLLGRRLPGSPTLRFLNLHGPALHVVSAELLDGPLRCRLRVHVTKPVVLGYTDNLALGDDPELLEERPDILIVHIPTIRQIPEKYLHHFMSLTSL